MVNGSTISVSVLEGDSAKLLSGGVPISVCIHLQDKGLHFEDAVWTAKQSKSGFSVSFYWKSGSEVKANVKKVNKGRKWKKKQLSSRNPGTSIQPAHPQSGTPVVKTPIDAHLDESVEKPCPAGVAPSTELLDLTQCVNVNYVEKDGEHGVCFDVDGEETWTPVVRRRRRSRLRSRSGSTSVSEEELTIPEKAVVTYVEVVKRGETSVEGRGTPGLRVNTRNTRQWIPISTRTRSQTKPK